jgi:molybdenum cofactor cytidylyltransferase
MRRSSPTQLKIGALILAAGASSRMGRPKMLLPWGNRTIIGHLIDQCLHIGVEQLAIVTSPDNQDLDRELGRLGFPEQNRIRNPAPEGGMYSSIQCAARWSGWQAGLTHWALALGDQPHLQPRTLLALMNLGTAHPEAICQLTRNGRPRHPVLLPASAFEQLASSRHRTLKEFLQAIAVNVILQESDDAGLDLDIDQPGDYEKAVRLFS